MTPDDREFGILIGKVDALTEQVAELRRTNSAEHAANGERLERLEASLREPLKDHEQRIDSLETTRDEGKGAARLVKVGQGAFALALVFLTYLATKGGVG